MDNTFIIERIKKLLALGAEGSGATPAEAAAAMRMAANLLAAHGLSEAQCMADSRVDNAPLFNASDVNEHSTGYHEPQGTWRWQLAWAAAYATECKPWKRNGMTSWIGCKMDPHVAATIYDALVDSVERATARYISKMPKGTRKRAAASFRYGWSRGASEAAKEGAREARYTKPEAQTGTALVLVMADVQDAKRGAITTFNERNGIKYVKAKSKSISDGDAYSAGFSAGKSQGTTRSALK